MTTGNAIFNMPFLFIYLLNHVALVAFAYWMFISILYCLPFCIASLYVVEI